MSLPVGFSPLPFDPARGVPQVVPLPGPVPGLRVALVAAAADLARLMSAAAEQVVHDVAVRRVRVSDTAPAHGDQSAHLAAHRTAVAGFVAAPRDSLDPAAVPVWLVVSGASGVHRCWPAVPGRPLGVRGDGRFLGDLWIDELRLAAGSLVRGGECGSRLAIGWRPAGGSTGTSATTTTGTTSATSTTGTTSATTQEEDPYVGLI